MKTRRMFLVALCGLAMIIGTNSCKKEKKETVGEKMRIEATLSENDGNAKTHLDGLEVKWDNGDAFNLYSKEGTQGSRFDLQSGEGETTAFFTGECPGDAPYYACYPSNKVSCGTKGVFTFEIPESQSEVTYAGPMVGCMESGDADLTFKNAMSWLAVGLKGNVALKRVTLTDKDGKKLNGTLTVTCTGDNAENFSFETEMTGGTSQLEIVSNEGFPLNTDSYTYFRFMVPAGSLESLKLSAYASTADDAPDLLGFEKTISGGMAENTILTADLNSSIIEASGATITTIAGCNTAGLFQLGAVVEGNDENLTTYQIGLCYNIDDETAPTIDNCDGKLEIGTFTIAKGSTKEITFDFAALTGGTYYTVCVYATNGVLTYGTPTRLDETGKPQPMSWENAQSPKAFTVKTSYPVKKVYFSQGNLQYIGSAATPYWKFANYQTDYLGHSNGTLAENADRDLIGWGDLTGYNTSVSDFDYSWTDDWGTKIGNGSEWRTLTKNEWNTLITREGKCGKGKVGGCTNGMIILPDEWTLPADLSFTPGIGETCSYETNQYTYAQWAQMETAGAVFLPAAGYRAEGTDVTNINLFGGYWSSDDGGPEYDGEHELVGYKGKSMYFNSYQASSAGLHHRRAGLSVRLVKEAN